MSDELIGTVTATPEGPIRMAVDGTAIITGRFALDGPSGADPGSSIYWFNCYHTSPPPPFAWGGDVIVSPETDFSMPFKPADLGLGIGTHTVQIQGGMQISIGGVPQPITTVDSNEITIEVQADPVEPFGWGEKDTGDAELSELSGTASLPNQSGDVALQGIAGTASLPKLDGVAEIEDVEGTA